MYLTDADSIGLAKYDTLHYEHYDLHDVRVWMPNGRRFNGLLIDVLDTGIVVHPNYLDGNEVIFIPSAELMKLNIYRSDFDRITTMKIFVYGLSAATFFFTVEHYEHHPNENLRQSKVLLGVLATLVSLPVSGLISSQIDRFARESYKLNGDTEKYKEHQVEIASYALWKHLQKGLYR